MRRIPSVLDAFAERMAALERRPLPTNLGTLLSEAAARYGSRPVWVPIDDPASALTFNQLAEWTARCVTYLSGIGIGPGTHVAVMLPNRPAFAITWLAIARLGAVMVSVNNHYTSRELAYVLDSSDAEYLVIDRSHLPALEAVPAAKMRISPDQVVVHGGSEGRYTRDWLEGVGSAMPATRPDPDVDTDQLLSIMFTSGSTGTPKGCLLSHRYWLTIGRVRAAHGVPVERFLADMPLHYMGGQWRFLMALDSGAAAFIAPQPSLTHLLDRLEAGGGLQFLVVNNAMAKLPDDPRYRSLRLRWAGSVGLQKELHEPFERRLGAPIRELYGTTETGATLHMPVEATAMVGSGSCGLPVAFRQCKIVGADGSEVPRGQSGELWVAGPGILQGHYKRPDVDANVRSGRWFRTGDLAHQDGDGYFYISGRIKDVIRRSNENIAAAEIESVLRALPEIQEAAAIPVPDPVRGEEVKVYVVLAAGLQAADVPPDAILQYCRSQLARFKVPRYLEYLSAMPMTASNKIAKPELVAARADLREGSYDFVEQLWR